MGHRAPGSNPEGLSQATQAFIVCCAAHPMTPSTMYNYIVATIDPEPGSECKYCRPPARAASFHR